MRVLYLRGESLSSLFDEKLGEIATVHGEGHSLHKAGEDNRGGVVTFNGVNHAHIVSHSQRITSVGRAFFEELWWCKCLRNKEL
jgi:hypothetical protein